MTTATLTKNGMINLPVEIRQKLDLKPGDKVNFVDTGNGIVIVPLKDIFDLIDPKDKETAIQMVKELIQEHKDEAGAESH